MATTRRVSPRKKPLQGRSRATVEAIVQATARVLIRDGYEACTTNRVAETAGVSIGSLYQYFPNKEALVVAVMERHLGALKEAMGRRLGELEGADLPTVIREMVRALLEVNQLQPKLHRVLMEQVPRIGALKRLHELHSQYEPLLTTWLQGHSDAGDEAGIEAYIIIAAAEGVVTRVLLEKPTWVESGALEAQLTRLVLGYFSTPVIEAPR